MKNSDIEKKVEMLLEKMDVNNMNSNVDSIMNLVDNISPNPRIRFRAVAIKSAVKSNPNEETQSLLKDEMRDLLHNIIIENKNFDEKINISSRDEVRSQFLNLSPRFPLVVRCNNITKFYSKSGFKLSGISCEFHQGEITGIVGENGHGKSTLLRIVAGRVEHDGGDLYYFFEDKLNRKKNWDNIKSNIAFLPQELPKQLGTLRQVISLTASLHGIKGEENDYETDYIINRMGLFDKQDITYKELSGGYRLRFMIAKMLVWKPKLLILDEPLGNLDINAQNILLTDLKYLSQSISNPISIIISSQHLEEVESVADNMLVLRDGRMNYFGKSSFIGRDLPNNVFEIKCPYTISEISEMLSGIEYEKLEMSGFNYVITTPKTVSRLELLNYLNQKNIEYTYFNDISNSSKRIILKSVIY